MIVRFILRLEAGAFDFPGVPGVFLTNYCIKRLRPTFSAKLDVSGTPAELALAIIEAVIAASVARMAKNSEASIFIIETNHIHLHLDGKGFNLIRP